jgi:hypothetical protein
MDGDGADRGTGDVDREEGARRRDTDAVTSMNNLVFMIKEKKAGCHRSYDRVGSTVRTKILGPGHPDTLSSAAAQAGWSDIDKLMSFWYFV